MQNTHNKINLCVYSIKLTKYDCRKIGFNVIKFQYSQSWYRIFKSASEQTACHSSFLFKIAEANVDF
jgi:hypothetical protein